MSLLTHWGSICLMYFFFYSPLIVRMAENSPCGAWVLVGTLTGFETVDGVMANICCVIAKDAWMLPIHQWLLPHIMSPQAAVIMPRGDRCPTSAGTVSSASTCSSSILCSVFDPDCMCVCFFACVCLPPPALLVDIRIRGPCQEFHNTIFRSFDWFELTYVSSWEEAN